MNRDELVTKVFEAGVVGAGGAGFPTHVKLQAGGIDTYLINAVECEPLLEGDKVLLRTEAENLVKIARGVAESIGAKRAIFVIKDRYSKEIALVRAAGGEVATIGNYYPAGDEVIMIKDVIDRTVPEGGLPLSVGVVVNNVETLLNIGAALDGKPVTHTFVTVGGAVARPCVLKVPIGVRASLLIEAAGGITIANPIYIHGGPMTGNYTMSSDFPVTKTTNGILVVPDDGALARQEAMPVETMLRQARIACIQCSQCTLVCSRNLVGHALKPHRIMAGMAWSTLRTPQLVSSAMLCSECNLCSGLVACPMGLSPRRVNQLIKKSLKEQKVRVTFPEKEYEPDSQRPYRLMPTPRLLHRLDLAKYDVHPPFLGEFQATEVEIPLQQHIGAPAVAKVFEGDSVAAGECIGRPKEGALGACIHTPIGGKVVSVLPGSVRIQA